MNNTWTKLNPAEKSRTYIYPPAYVGAPEGRFTVTNVTEINVSPSGTHYLECDEGKIIMRCGWMAITLDVDEWTHPKKEKHTTRKKEKTASGGNFTDDPLACNQTTSGS
jgi:hypothetical protein